MKDKLFNKLKESINEARAMVIKDKIAEVKDKLRSDIFLCLDKYIPKEAKHLSKILSEHCLDLIAKELDSPTMLPILAELVCGCEQRRQEDIERDDLVHQDRSDLYSNAIERIKHKLGVVRNER